MDKFCGQITDRIATPIYSDLAFLQVTFKSNRLFEGNGFNATYQFIEGMLNGHVIFFFFYIWLFCIILGGLLVRKDMEVNEYKIWGTIKYYT